MFFNNAMPDDYKSLSGIIVTKEKSKTLEEAEESTEMKVIKKNARRLFSLGMYACTASFNKNIFG